MIKKVINKYKNAFENLEIKNINSLLNLVDENVMFEDPFNKIIGKENFKKLLLEMFKKLQNTFAKSSDETKNSDSFCSFKQSPF